MNTQTIYSLIKYFPQGASMPDFIKFPVAHDFVLNGAPCAFKRYRNGDLMVKKGNQVITDFGLGYVEHNLDGGDYIIRIVDFYHGRFGTSDKSVSAQDFVSRLSNLYNDGIMERALFFENQIKDKKHAACLLERMIDSDCYVQSLSSESDYCGATEFAFNVVMDETRGQVLSEMSRKERKKLRALASQLIDEDDNFIPEDIAAELDEEFGAFEESDSIEDAEPLSEDED